MRAGKDVWLQNCNVLVERELPSENTFREYFCAIQTTLVNILGWDQLISKDPFLTNIRIEELQQINLEFYRGVSLDADIDGNVPYDYSYANPDYAVKKFGTDLGQLLCAIFVSCRNARLHLIKKNFHSLNRLTDLIATLMKDAEENLAGYDKWLELYRKFSISDIELHQHFNMYWRYCPDNTFYKDVVVSADLTDLRYLYRYGMYLSEHDFAMARFMNNYPEKELQALADYIVKAYIDGFIRGHKDYKIKKYATLMIPCGMEKIGRMVIAKLEALGLQVLVPQPMNPGINKQFNYDHRFDNALWFNAQYVDEAIASYERTTEAISETMGSQAGPVYIELFGEVPFSPVPKQSALKLSDEQQLLKRKHSAATSQIFMKHAKRHESSFCIIAFPSSEIGDKFAEIFADTIKINLLDSDLYARIQQNIIDVLDTAEYVHVKGKAGNETDIMVRMQKITDPQKETLFENCVADVNVPVGEVFTSPLLTGTNGVLHVEDIYLDNLRYFNIKLRFKDGWIEDYSCTNFTDEAENRKYIEENLLMPHKSLPIGEFAIGTNTTAYQIAKKHDILALLPILIIEKMGPHFAIGDTCFSYEEDSDNLSFVNGKKMIAVENEKSATRKEDPMNAYLQAHTDITLPYEMLESITAIAYDGSQKDIIRDGLFVVPGTEELNEPLLQMRK
jgi:hypothetical protein